MYFDNIFVQLFTYTSLTIVVYVVLIKLKCKPSFCFYSWIKKSQFILKTSINAVKEHNLNLRIVYTHMHAHTHW